MRVVTPSSKYLIERLISSLAESEYFPPDDQMIGAVAQMGERLDRTQEVRGSIPLGSTNQFRSICRFPAALRKPS